MTDALDVWLVEDEALYRDRFAQLLRTSPDLRLSAGFESYASLAGRLPTDVPPDLVVMDLQMPGTDGFEATRRLRHALPATPVVVLTLLDDPPSIVTALRAGASGYVVKGTDPEDLFRSLREAHAGGTFFAPAVARHVLGHFAPEHASLRQLTPREREVLQVLAEGHSKAGIAERLFVSPHTVDTHLRSVYDKLHVRTAAQAAAVGVREGLI